MFESVSAIIHKATEHYGEAPNYVNLHDTSAVLNGKNNSEPKIEQLTLHNKSPNSNWSLTDDVVVVRENPIYFATEPPSSSGKNDLKHSHISKPNKNKNKRDGSGNVYTARESLSPMQNREVSSQREGLNDSSEYLNSPKNGLSVC